MISLQVASLDEIDQKAKRVLILDEPLQDLSLVESTKVFSLYNLHVLFRLLGRCSQLSDLRHSCLLRRSLVDVHIRVSCLLRLLNLLLSNDIINTAPEDIYKLLALLGLLHPLREVLLYLSLAIVLISLHIDLPLELLDLVKVADQVLLEVILDVTRHDLDAMVRMINLTQIQLVLNVVHELYVVLRRVNNITRTSAFSEGPFKLGLILVGLGVLNKERSLSRLMSCILLARHRRRILVAIGLVRGIIRNHIPLRLPSGSKPLLVLRDDLRGRLSSLVLGGSSYVLV